MYGDTVVYLLASVEMQQSGVVFMVDVGVLDYLPMSALLDTYASQLAEWLNGVGKQTELNGDSGKAMDIRIVHDEVPVEATGEKWQRCGARPSSVDK